MSMSGRLTTDGAAGRVKLDFTGLDIDLTGPKMLRLVLEVDKPHELEGLSLFLGVGGFSNYVRWLFQIRTSTQNAFRPNQPTIVTLQLAEIHAVGGAITLSPSGVPSVTSGFTHARLMAVDTAREPVTVTLFSASVVPPTRPGAYVSVTFDDGLESVSTRAWPTMRALGLRGTEYPIVELVGRSGRVTFEDLRRRYLAGWEIGGHSYSATAHLRRYTGLTAAQALGDMRANIAWLERHFPADAYTMAYPNGEFTETTDGASIEDITLTAGYTAARSTLANPGVTTHLQIESLNPPILTRLYCASGVWGGAVGQQNPANLMAAGGMLDRLEQLGGWLILAFHRIVDDTPSESTEISRADFDALMENLASRMITVLPVRDVLVGLPRVFPVAGTRLEALIPSGESTSLAQPA